eukprot:7092150-Prymnesium_polylepis.2
MESCIVSENSAGYVSTYSAVHPELNPPTTVVANMLHRDRTWATPCSTLCEQHVDDVDVDDVHVMSRCTCPCMLHVHAHAHAHVVATSPTGGMLSQGGGLHVVDSAGVRMVSCTFHSNSALLSVSEQPPHCRPATSLPCTLTPRQRFQPFPVCEPAGINLLCFARFRAQTCTLMSAALVTPACGPHSSLSK